MPQGKEVTLDFWWGRTSKTWLSIIVRSGTHYP